MGPRKDPVFTLSEEQLESLADKVSTKLEEKMAKRNVYVDTKLEQLNHATDELEQHNRIENLRIFGIEEKKEENTDLLVHEVAKKINVVLQPTSISRSHRVGPIATGKTRAIIVKFVSYADRKKMFKAKKLLKGSGVTITEDLTKYRQAILKKAIDVYTKEYAWSDNGIIFVKIGKTFHRAKTMCEIEDIIKRYPPGKPVKDNK